ncbi:MAG: hypothetical protein ACOC9Y_04180, partial [Chloroflexota bacterium]
STYGDPMRQALLGHFAEELWSAERTGQPAQRIQPAIPDLTLDEAEEIRRLVDVMRMDQRAVPVGRRVFFGRRRDLIDYDLEAPRWTYFFSSQRLPENGPMGLDLLLSPRLALSLALVISRDVTNAEIDPSALALGLGGVAPALELLDSRYAAWDLSAGEIIADNGLLSGVALGQVVPIQDADHLLHLTARVTSGDRRMVGGLERVSQLRGGPLGILSWLAREAIALDEPIRAGEIILTGPFSEAVVVQRSQRYVGEFAGLGDELALVTLHAR